MVLGSHNAWTFQSPTKWWMRLISFTAKCQSLNIYEQYTLGVRCFDLRVRFKKGKLIIAHGVVEYPIKNLFNELDWLDRRSEKIYVRVFHETRTEEQHSEENIELFADFIIKLQCMFTKIIFWGGKNLYNWVEDYEFPYKPTYEEEHASVNPPKFLDDWWPWLYAYKHNKDIIRNANCEILLIDFVNYGH